MNEKKPHIIKVKVRNATTENTDRNPKLEENETSTKITLSAELLKGIISLVFMALTISCFVIDICVAVYDFSKTDNIFSRILLIINSILLVFLIIIEVLLLADVKKGTTKKVFFNALGTSLLISGFCILADAINDLTGSTLNEFNYLFFMYLSPVFICLFIAIYVEIQNEKDKNYIVGYFSALTSFAALIVALVALLK